MHTSLMTVADPGFLDGGASLDKGRASLDKGGASLDRGRQVRWHSRL